ncbi:diguanylate cyclase (GGDEF)-like protein [Pelomonas aquatica]|uniref:diguanylate cyclase n=1 Tax=Pelomonas aquatica TaxID=431058 RepID=A0ABU1Z2D1_9BURK|nr:diguanylate cyclase [Pelomonas aquatica]MDR7294748.1 diguanylate cyclase (GGDEF)-like protein [Pelomonas aquatica]
MKKRCWGGRHQVWRWCVVGVLWLLSGVAWAGGIDLQALPADGLALGPHWELLQDADRKLDLDGAVRGDWQPSTASGEAVSFGYTGVAVWLRLPLRNGGSQPVQAMLDISYPLLQYLDVMLLAPDGTAVRHETGYQRAFAQRPWPGGNFSVPVTLAPGETRTLMLRVASANSLIVPARLWRADAFPRFDQRRLAVQMLYFGLALAVGLYNLVIFLLLRDASFGWYVLFAGSIAAALACFTGIGSNFLWPDAPYWQQRGVNVPGSVAAIALMMFSRRMLRTPQTMPRLDLGLRALIALNVLLIPLLMGWFAQTAPFWAVCSATTAALLLACGITGTLQRQRSAYFFVVAFSVLLVAVLLGHMRNLGVLPSNLITSAGTQAGSAVDLLLLSLALADRYARMRADKEQAQARALQAEQARVQALTDSERVLEARVLERTAALEAANRQLELMSQTDGLTGLANRRHFDAVLAAEWARAQRAGQPLGLGLLDADLFKAYNDRMGHVAGDDCLRQIAAVLAETVGRRSGELVARYGGEEFAFIVPGAGAAQMLALGERIVAALRARALPHPASPTGHVTASIGLAAEVPVADRHPELLVQTADEALYAAKAAGRDRVWLAHEG